MLDKVRHGLRVEWLNARFVLMDLRRTPWWHKVGMALMLLWVCAEAAFCFGVRSVPLAVGGFLLLASGVAVLFLGDYVSREGERRY